MTLHTGEYVLLAWGLTFPVKWVSADRQYLARTLFHESFSKDPQGVHDGGESHSLTDEDRSDHPAGA